MKNNSSPLELAMEFELEGKEYFTRAAEKVTHPLGKKMFEALATDENKHLHKISQIKENLQNTDSWPTETTMVTEGGSLTSVFETARKNIDKDITASENDLDVLKQAMEMETKGYEFYNDLVEKSTNPEEKSFYTRLATEERGHYNMLQNTQEYLRSPADWFAGEERSIFEG